MDRNESEKVWLTVIAAVATGVACYCRIKKLSFESGQRVSRPARWSRVKRNGESYLAFRPGVAS